MIKGWLELRAIVWLKRIALALEETNRLTGERMGLEFPNYGRSTGKLRSSKLVEISTASVEEWNEAYREEKEGK